MSDRRDRLTNFLNALLKEGIITDEITTDSEKALDNRIRIQKCVYLARYFNIDLGYSDTYDIYLYGPYSSTLADDYFDIAESGKLYANDSYEEYKEFIEFVKDKDTAWLEIASTALDFAVEHDNIYSLIKHVSYVKPRYSKKKVKRVIEELRANNLLPLATISNL